MGESLLEDSEIIPISSSKKVLEVKKKLSMFETVKYKFSHKLIMIPILMYAVLSLCSTIMTESLPLFVILPISQGGFNWKPQQNGLLLAIVGVSVVPYQLLIYPFVAKKFGPLYAYRFGIGMLSLFIFSIPVFFFSEFQSNINLGLLLIRDWSFNLDGGYSNDFRFHFDKQFRNIRN